MTLATNKVHGQVSAGEHLTLSMDFYTITTAVNILQGAFGDASQIALDRLVSIVSLNGQPVIMSAPYVDGSSHYVLKFAIEHAGSWTDGATLKAAIIANTPASMGFAADSVLAVTIASSF